MDAIGPRAISRGHFTLAHQIDNLLAVRFGQFEAATELAPGFERLGQSGFSAFTDYGPAGASQQKVTVSILKLIGETEGSARLLCKIRVNHAMMFKNSQRPAFPDIDF